MLLGMQLEQHRARIRGVARDAGRRTRGGFHDRGTSMKARRARGRASRATRPPSSSGATSVGRARVGGAPHRRRARRVVRYHAALPFQREHEPGSRRAILDADRRQRHRLRHRVQLPAASRRGGHSRLYPRERREHYTDPAVPGVLTRCTKSLFSFPRGAPRRRRRSFARAARPRRPDGRSGRASSRARSDRRPASSLRPPRRRFGRSESAVGAAETLALVSHERDERDSRDFAERFSRGRRRRREVRILRRRGAEGRALFSARAGRPHAERHDRRAHHGRRDLRHRRTLRQPARIRSLARARDAEGGDHQDRFPLGEGRHGLQYRGHSHGVGRSLRDDREGDAEASSRPGHAVRFPVHGEPIDPRKARGRDSPKARAGVSGAVSLHGERRGESEPYRGAAVGRERPGGSAFRGRLGSGPRRRARRETRTRGPRGVPGFSDARDREHGERAAAPACGARRRARLRAPARSLEPQELLPRAVPLLLFRRLERRGGARRGGRVGRRRIDRDAGRKRIPKAL